MNVCRLEIFKFRMDTIHTQQLTPVGSHRTAAVIGGHSADKKQHAVYLHTYVLLELLHQDQDMWLSTRDHANFDGVMRRQSLEDRCGRLSERAGRLVNSCSQKTLVVD